ncbi:Phosphoethanolamine N-methyltransferase 3 [Merluccius polli]|uniref:phosphoethanolamine N-methyltransferase n=1 Tax=Merluccius polli TaxID=89951 RepID=A0AA47NVI8_MERPO|nr:Phosphoethanolamine N-methyltransferase 3 [Merluccius polli]
MIKFWKEHSTMASVDEMVLDNRGKELTEQELPEILSLLPSLAGKPSAGPGCWHRVSEALCLRCLGCICVRFTSHLLTSTDHVMAVDFMESLIEKNRQENGHHSNAAFLQADVTKLEFPTNRYDLVNYDVIFSNWLLMYLSDEELERLVEKMPGAGWHPPVASSSSGSPAINSQVIVRGTLTQHCTGPWPSTATSSHQHSGPEPEGQQKFGFDVVLTKKVQTYVKILLAAGKSSSFQGHSGRFNTFQQFLDNRQYTQRGILRYEKMFGAGYVSTGGLTTTKSWLRPGGQLLISDYCCGETLDPRPSRSTSNRGGYILYTVKQYARLLKRLVSAVCGRRDRTAQFIRVIQTELDRADAIKGEFIKEFSEEATVPLSTAGVTNCSAATRETIDGGSSTQPNTEAVSQFMGCMLRSTHSKADYITTRREAVPIRRLLQMRTSNGVLLFLFLEDAPQLSFAASQYPKILCAPLFSAGKVTMATPSGDEFIFKCNKVLGLYLITFTYYDLYFY